MAESLPGDCWVGVCADGNAPRAEVEHRLLDLGAQLGGAPEVATHVVRAPGGNHHAGTLRLTTPADLAGVVGAWLRPEEAAVLLAGEDEVHLGGAPHREHAAVTARAHRDRASGRLLRFPGQDALPDVLPLAELTARSAVEVVELLGVAEAPGLLLRTRGHVRPHFRGGVLVLPVTAWDDGEVCPFERADPRACCSDH